MREILKIGREKWTRDFDPSLPPITFVKAGTELVISTWCCSKETVTREVSTAPEQFYAELNYTRGMPITGPIFIEGAQVGDVLMLEILDIGVANHGWTMANQGGGPLGQYIHSGESRIIPIEDNQLVFLNKVKLPKHPMIGCLGVTPTEGPLRAGFPGIHGGNMDCKILTAGATLFLPVLVPGALLATGDLHAIQGYGELGMAGAEISGEVRLHIELLKGADLPLPFLINEEVAATIYSAKGLTDAAEGSVKMMADFLTCHSGLSLPDANMLLSLAGDLRICQIVNPLMTCRTEIPIGVLSQLGIEFPTMIETWINKHGS
jgi:amidase